MGTLLLSLVTRIASAIPARRRLWGRSYNGATLRVGPRTSPARGGCAGQVNHRTWYFKASPGIGRCTRPSRLSKLEGRNIYVLLLHWKTRGHRYNECATRCRGAIICRTGTNVGLSDARRKPLDTLSQAAGISLRIGHALCAGRTSAPNFSHQHDGDAYAKFESGPTRQLARDPKGRRQRSARLFKSHTDRERS